LESNLLVPLDEGLTVKQKQQISDRNKPWFEAAGFAAGLLIVALTYTRLLS